MMHRQVVVSEKIQLPGNRLIIQPKNGNATIPFFASSGNSSKKKARFPRIEKSPAPFWISGLHLDHACGGHHRPHIRKFLPYLKFDIPLFSQCPLIIPERFAGLATHFLVQKVLKAFPGLLDQEKSFLDYA